MQSWQTTTSEPNLATPLMYNLPMAAYPQLLSTDKLYGLLSENIYYVAHAGKVYRSCSYRLF